MTDRDRKRKAKTMEGHRDESRREMAARIYAAFNSYNATNSRDQRITQEELGAAVAKKLGLKEAITQPAVSSWMNTDNPKQPDNHTVAAIAEILHIDFYWLLLGEKATRD